MNTLFFKFCYFLIWLNDDDINNKLEEYDVKLENVNEKEEIKDIIM